MHALAQDFLGHPAGVGGAQFVGDFRGHQNSAYRRPGLKMPWGSRRPFQASMQGEQGRRQRREASSRQRSDSGARYSTAWPPRRAAPRAPPPVRRHTSAARRPIRWRADHPAPDRRRRPAGQAPQDAAGEGRGLCSRTDCHRLSASASTEPPSLPLAARRQHGARTGASTARHARKKPRWQRLPAPLIQAAMPRRRPARKPGCARRPVWAAP